MLRHAGAMYALSSYHERWPSPESAAALGRAAGFLRRATAPVDGDRVALWSADDRDEAKLGGAGLALVALSASVLRPAADDPILSGLGRFVVSLQKPDGSFYSKYFRAGGADDSWTSLYYPGEAALGLTRLAALMADGAWAAAATRALGYLASARKNARSVPADHWALIATRELLARTDVEAPTRAELLQHARQICRSMLEARSQHPPGSPLHGCFGSDGRTTPTATRLEGLLAAHALFDDDDPIRPEMESAIDAGIGFLLRAQRHGPPYPGAVPHALSDDEGATEVRIDYVQHALSAWIAEHDRLQTNQRGRSSK
jgi:hypothetical protein